MMQLITTYNQQYVSNITDDIGIALLHLSPNVIPLRSLLHLRPNVITLRSLLHLRAVITFRSSTSLASKMTYATSLMHMAFENVCLFLIICPNDRLIVLGWM